MRIISCASYYGTGSSAITDFVSEYGDCMSLTDYEFKFLQDPDGVRDLEFQLLENHNRHTSGYALKKYKRVVDMLGNTRLKKYEHFFNGQWKKISYEYIDQLTEFVYTGYWHQDVLDRGLWFYIRKRIINKILQKTIWRNQPEVALNELPSEITYCSYPTKEEFYRYTKEYIEKLFQAANVENKANVMVDQIVPPSNLNHYLNYFNDIRVFVVDRDPRDVYLAEKYIYKGAVVPTESVELFCKWYEYTRRHRANEHYDNEHIMFVRFEDLIYRYDATAKKIADWLGLEEKNHVDAKKKFVPERSIKNTRLWEKIPNVESEMAYIEKTLPQYLYDYDEVKH